jgi:Raf kinase inhibitor-like YbhB/YbcL family protein
MTNDRRRLPGFGLAAVLVLAAISLACRPPQEGPDETNQDGGPQTPKTVAKLVVSSPAFEAGGELPAEFTCDGASASPPVEWSGAPEGTRCFALNVWHVPGPGGLKSYWVVYNIPADVTGLPKNATNIGVDGINDKGRKGYDPMCSKGPGAKKYHITVHALSEELKPSRRGLNRAELLEAIQSTELAQGTLTFTYTRPSRN